jgi:hypothetical protein
MQRSKDFTRKITSQKRIMKIKLRPIEELFNHFKDNYLKLKEVRTLNF